jgi:acetoin utilization protein AcuB
MTENPVTVTADTTVSDVAEILRDMDIRHIPVTRDGALVGIVSDRDLKGLDAPEILELSAPSVRARLAEPVSRLMSADVISVDPEADLSDIVSLMIETKVGAVPVVDPETREVVGIVSYIDVLRAVQDMLEE